MNICCNCGGSLEPSCIPFGDEGEAVCSNYCWNQHEALGCPLETGGSYRANLTDQEGQNR